MAVSELTSIEFVRTPDDFYRIVKLGQTPESITLDFKKDIEGYLARGIDTREHQKELCRDIAQFANTFGGCVLLGIEESHIGAKKVATTIHSLSDFDGRRQWIEQAVQNFLIPATIPFQLLPIELPDGLIIAINVPAHEHLVWIWDRNMRIMQCVRRANHGKEYLNPDEVEVHLMDSSRARKLAFLRVISTAVRREVQLVSGVWTVSSGGPIGSSALLKMPAEVFLGVKSDHEFELRVKSSFLNGIVSIYVPYGLISESWVTSEGQIGILLKVRLITGQSRDHLTMEIP